MLDVFLEVSITAGVNSIGSWIVFLILKMVLWPKVIKRSNILVVDFFGVPHIIPKDGEHIVFGFFIGDLLSKL